MTEIQQDSPCFAACLLDFEPSLGRGEGFGKYATVRICVVGPSTPTDGIGPKQGLGTLGGAAFGTLLGAFIGSEIGVSLDRADQLALERSREIALNTPRLRQPIGWRNGHTGARGTVTVGGRTQDAYGTACQQRDGSWEIVS
jgi:surface antigen